MTGQRGKNERQDEGKIKEMNEEKEKKREREGR